MPAAPMQNLSDLVSALYYDASGTGAGPFIPTTTLVDKNGVPITSFGGASIGYGGALIEIDRPNNVTPYTALDVVGGVIHLTNMGPSAGGIVRAVSARLRLDIASIPSGMTTFGLECYNVTPPSALADNAAWGLGAADRDAYIGRIELGAPQAKAGGVSCYSQYDNQAVEMRLLTADIWAYLVTTGGFTPAAVSEKYYASVVAEAR